MQQQQCKYIHKHVENEKHFEKQYRMSPSRIHQQNLELARRITEDQRNEIANRLFKDSFLAVNKAHLHEAKNADASTLHSRKIEPNSLYKMSFSFILNK